MTSQKISKERTVSLLKLSRKIKIPFKEISIFDLAFTHSSFKNEVKNSKTSKDNERLEFLGDSVLGFVASEFLYEKFPDSNEGELSRIKSKIVSGEALNRISTELNLSDYVLMGKGEKETGGAYKKKNNANIVEALIAAIYIDSGIENVKKFLVKFLIKITQHLEEIESVKDYKSILQEYCQKKTRLLPKYKLLNEKGPEHSKDFTISVKIQNYSEKIATAKSKKLAEQLAAKKLLEEIQNEGFEKYE